MEQAGSYYHTRYGVDFRSVRYPGFISPYEYEANGTTDYASQIFFTALRNKEYNHYLSANRKLPMIYIDEGIEGTIQFVKADQTRFTSRIYNLNGLSFTCEEISRELKKFIPGLKYKYEPDYREKIAASWPEVIEGELSKKDWDWKPQIDTTRKLVVKSLFDIENNDEYKHYFKGNNYKQMIDEAMKELKF